MVNEKARARIEALKRDQDTLRTQLAELDTFMEKKARRRPRPKGQREYVRRGDEYERPARPREYDRREPRYDRREERDERREERVSARDDEIYEMLDRNLQETRRMMDKFDYLLDTLVSSMEEVEGENVDDLVKSLAQSQMHVMDVLTGIKDGLDKTGGEAATKKEMDDFERSHTSHYQELNKKINMIMEQMQSPPYLQELDQIKVDVANLGSELKRIGTGGIGEGADAAVSSLKTQTESLNERLGNIHSSIENLGQHVNEMQAATSGLGELKKQIGLMRDTLSAKDDEILTQTHMKIESLEKKMVDLNMVLEKLKLFEDKLAKSPVAEVGRINDELAELKKGMPAKSVQALHHEIDTLDERLTSELKKKADGAENREILDRLVRRAGELDQEIEEIREHIPAVSEEEIEKRVDELTDRLMESGDVHVLKEELDTLGHQLASVQAASAYGDEALKKRVDVLARQLVTEGSLEVAARGESEHEALKNKVEALEDMAGKAAHYGEVKELQAEAGKMRDELKRLRRSIKSVEVIESYSRMRDKKAGLDTLKDLGTRLSTATEALDERARGIEAELKKSEGAGKTRDARAMKALEALRRDMGEAKEKAATLEKAMGSEDFRKMLGEQRARLAEVEAEFDRKTMTLDRELGDAKEVFKAMRDEREKKIRLQLDGLRGEIAKAREDAKELPPKLVQRIDKLYAEMERLKSETPEELKTLARSIGSVSRTMDDIQKGLRYGEARQEQLDELAGGVGKLYSMVNELTREAGKSKLLLERVVNLEKALAKAGEMQGKELESTIGAIKGELAELEKEVGKGKGDRESLSREVESVHTDIKRLEKKTRDEIYAHISDLKEHVVGTDDIGEVRKALEVMEKHAAGEGMERIRDRVQLAKGAAEQGDVDSSKAIVRDMPVPKHVVARVSVGSLEKLEKQLGEADEDYVEFLEKVRAIREEYEDKGVSEELEEELAYLEEDLLDFWLDKRGLTEALAQAKKGDMEAARQLLDYERSALEDLKLDINSLRRRAATLPRKAVEQAEAAIERREHVEEELGAFSELKESLDGMKREREKLKKEIQAAKAKTTTSVVPEKVQESLDVAKMRPTPAVGREVERLEKEVAEKHVVPISERNLEKARQKIGELAGKARQIEFGTGDERASVAREQLEAARGQLAAPISSSESIKAMALSEELSRMQPDGRMSLDELSSRTGIPIKDIERILPSLGAYGVSGGFVAKAKAF
ncbi:MAG: hypothetical protein KAW41_03090 [Candidatus Diapherotrites archaeon]|nr:hypothetical protein [Candidatus Diapherotrites archaeon]